MLIPDEIKDALSTLSHSIRWRIIELIREDESLSYTELLKRLTIRKGSLTHHLNRLMETGILDNYSEEEFGGPYTSYYQFSPFGKDLIAGILSSVETASFPERKEKPTELPKLDIITHDMREQSKYVTPREIMRALKGELKESDTPSVSNLTFREETMNKIDRRNLNWPEGKRELKLNIRSSKTNE